MTIPTRAAERSLVHELPWTPEDILRLRRHLGHAQFDFAILLGVKRATISEWERGASTPRRANRLQLARIARESGFPYQGEIDAATTRHLITQSRLLGADKRFRDGPTIKIWPWAKAPSGYRMLALGRTGIAITLVPASLREAFAELPISLHGIGETHELVDGAELTLWFLLPQE